MHDVAHPTGVEVVANGKDEIRLKLRSILGHAIGQLLQARA